MAVLRQSFLYQLIASIKNEVKNNNLNCLFLPITMMINDKLNILVLIKAHELQTGFLRCSDFMTFA